MKVWLIGLGLSLLCSVLAVDVNLQEVAGEWHNVVMASDCNCLLKHKEKMKTVVVSLIPQETEDSVVMETSIPMPGGCKKISMKFDKLESGHYFHSCEWGDKTIEEVDTTHDGTLIIKAIHEKKGKLCRVWTLLTRSRTPSEEVVKAFVSDAEAAGFTANQIKIMPPEVACIESQ